jgi:hypothetical protein
VRSGTWLRTLASGGSTPYRSPTPSFRTCWPRRLGPSSWRSRRRGRS